MEKFLEQIKHHLPMKNHVAHEIIYDDLEIWKAKGSPFVWLEPIKAPEATLFVEVAYGKMALVVNEQIVSVGEKLVGTNDCNIIALSGYYVNTESIYKRIA